MPTVADFLDGEDLGEETGLQVLPEARFVNQGGQESVGFGESSRENGKSRTDFRKI